MVQIQPVNVWKNGEETQAHYFSLVSIYDNLQSSATFYYQLFSQTQNEQEENVPGSPLSDGNLTIGGQDYIDWGTQSGVDINTWAYDWAAGQLNLVII